MSQHANSSKIFRKEYSRKFKPIFNYNTINKKDEAICDYSKDKKDEKQKKETVIYKRRNTEYDIHIYNKPMEDIEITDLNLAKNRSRNYTNEGNGGLYTGGKTRFLNAIRQNNYQQTNNNDINLYETLRSSDIRNFRKINENRKEKSESSLNSNRHNHSYYESHYSNGMKKQLDNIETKLTLFKNEITKTIKESQKETKDAILNSQKETKNELLRVLNSISDSMKILISGQNKLIQLSKNKK